MGDFNYTRGPGFREEKKRTLHHIQNLLPKILNQIGKIYHDRPDLILASWPDVIGPKLSSMTQALSFSEGVLLVLVKNSTLYSLISTYEKPRLLKNLREKFPGTTIKSIRFRLG